MITASGLEKWIYYRYYTKGDISYDHSIPTERNELLRILKAYRIGVDDVQCIEHQIDTMKMLRKFLRMIKDQDLQHRVKIRSFSGARVEGGVFLTPEGLKRYINSDFYIISDPDKITLGVVRDWDITYEEAVKAKELLEVQ